MNSEDILVVIAYESDSVAQTARQRLEDLSVEDLIDLDVAAYVTKDMKGKIKIHRQRGHGGIRGIVGGRSDRAEIDDEILQESAQMIEPGGAALCLMVGSLAPEKVIPEINKYGGTVIKTSLPADRDQLLKESFEQHFTAEQVSTELNS